MSKMDYPDDAPKARADVFKPMLSATCGDITTLRYPVLVSPKLDGIRCLIRGGVAVSRNLKPIPNAYIQECLKGLPDGLDGELIVGEPTGDDVMNRTSSGVMRADGEPDFTYWVFDAVAALPFVRRYQALLHGFSMVGLGSVLRAVPHVTVTDAKSLQGWEAHYVAEGYEGVMIRDPHGAYKHGRSTVKEGGLLKLKRWHDAEAVVIGVVERQHNGNEATTDALGRTKRSAHKANKTGRGDLGALVCALPHPADDPKHPDHHKTRPATLFELGTGFTDEQRKAIWRQADVIGKAVTFKYQALTPDGIPRFPVFKAFRDPRDMST